MSNLQVIREEFIDFNQKNQNIFYLNPTSELYKDLEDIAQRKISQQIKLYSHQEAWTNERSAQLQN